MKLDGLIKAVGDQSTLLTYADVAQYQNTTNSTANAFWVPSNCTASGAVGANDYGNLIIDDNKVLYYMFTNFYSQGSGFQTPANLRLLRKSYETKCQLVNNETSKVSIIEYRCQARYDEAESVAGIFTQMAGYSTAADLEFKQEDKAGTPLTAPTISTIVNGGYTSQMGVTPFMLHGFTQRFKIKKVKAHNLMPGKHKTIIYRSKKPRLFKYQEIFSQIERIRENASTNIGDTYGLRRGQAFSLFVVNGTWATNSGANAGYKHGISNICVGMVYQVKVHYDLFTAAVPSTSVANNIPGFSANASQVPLPIVANQPISALAVGASATGTRVYEAGGTTIVDMVDAIQNNL